MSSVTAEAIARTNPLNSLAIAVVIFAWRFRLDIVHGSEGTLGAFQPIDYAAFVAFSALSAGDGFAAGVV
jgi:hypothetical protein